MVHFSCAVCRLLSFRERGKLGGARVFAFCSRRINHFVDFPGNTVMLLTTWQSGLAKIHGMLRCLEVAVEEQLHGRLRLWDPVLEQASHLLRVLVWVLPSVCLAELVVGIFSNKI